MKLTGKVVVVTGASGGIGLCVARALLREGARVAFAARSRARLDEEVRRAAAEGGEAIAVAMDVTSDESVAAALAEVGRAFGGVDVVINNAGSGGALSLWSSNDAAALRAMFDVHVFGMERVTRAALPLMLARGGGAVVNVASTVGWVPMPGAAAYSAAKAAVISLSESLRAELSGRGIDVRLFAPPHTSTEAGKAWPLDLPKIFAPDWVAAALIRMLKRDRVRVVAGGNGMLLFLQRLSPRLATRIMNGLGFRALAKAGQLRAEPPRALPG
jgi:NAD(P)-dependent dehydrogenase (short-subunit alcohol dehydrogenase family)